jgi:OmpA family
VGSAAPISILEFPRLISLAVLLLSILFALPLPLAGSETQRTRRILMLFSENKFLPGMRSLKQAGGMSGLLFVVTGHTDNAGSEKYNYELARIRAENAAIYLANQKKVNPSQLVVMSYGESVPVADNRTEAGRAKNRRIEILVYRDTVTVGSSERAAPGR